MTRPDPRYTPSCADCGYGAAVIDADGRCRACAVDLDDELIDVGDARSAAAVEHQLAADARAAVILPPASDLAVAYAGWVLATASAYRDVPSAVTARARANSVAPEIRRASGEHAATVRPGAAQPTARTWRDVISLGGAR